PVDDSACVGGVLVIAEVEEFVLDDWAADRSAGLPVVRRRGAVREVISRLEPTVVVVAEKEGAAVKIIRPRFKRYRGNCAARASEICCQSAGRDADRFDGVRRRD